MKNKKQSGKTNKTKEQLAYEMKIQADYERSRAVAREKIWPVIMQYAKDAKHAEQTLQIFKTVINQVMQMPYRDMKVSGLNLAEELTKDKDASDQAFHFGLIEALNDVSIVEAMKLMEGMAGSINGYTMNLAGQKPMAEIQLDEIIK